MAHFGKLKAKMSRLRDLQCKRLVSLSNMASQAKSELEKRKGLAERILKLAELARKYETEREKVLPLQDMHAVEVEEKEADLVESELLADAPTKPAATATGRAPLALEHATSAFTQAGQPVAGWDYLQRFHMRLNKALMDRAALTKERERLQGENGDLQRILKQVRSVPYWHCDAGTDPTGPYLSAWMAWLSQPMRWRAPTRCWLSTAK